MASRAESDSEISSNVMLPGGRDPFANSGKIMFKRTPRARFVGAQAALLLLAAGSAHADVFINEFHYDNNGTDANEKVEIIAPAGTSLAGWKVYLYNGSGGTSYLTVNLSGTTANQCGGHGTVVANITGAQNGAPDGIALVNASGTLVQFLSYEGTFTGSGGPANGVLSTAVPVSEAGTEPSTYSLQLAGTGNKASDFTWQAARTSSWGACNTGQTLSGGGTDAAPTLSSSTPASGATGVAVNSNISLTFSEAVTVTGSWATLSCSSSGSHPFAVSGGPTTFTLNPNTDFGNSETCTLTLTAANIFDQDGTATPMAANVTRSFTTVAGGGGGTTLSNGVAKTGLAAATGASLSYTLSVPAGATNLSFVMSGGTGDADMYVRFGSAPTTATYDCRPYKTGNAETCTFASPSAGTWYVMLSAYTSFSGVSLLPSYSTGVADVAPTLSSSTPASGATNVAINSDISLTFSEAVTVTGSWYSLTCANSGSHAAAVSGGPTTFTLNPTVDFGNLETCTLTLVAANIVDQDGTANAMAANVSRSFTTSAAASGYYASVNAGSAATLRSTLHPVIDDHTKIPYTASTTDTWDVLNVADQDPLNSGRVLDIYKNTSYAKATGGNDFYNREHTWPNSLGFPNDGSTNYAYTDLHMLMISDISYNSTRSNKPYDNCTSGCTSLATATYNGAGGASDPNLSSSSVFQVWSKVKGNVARAMFYMDIRYEGGSHGVSGAAEPDLRLTDNLSEVVMTGTNASVAYMGKLSTLIQWHLADPVDAAEQLRNDVIETYQGNRNPFIDHPEWVVCLYQGVCN